MDAAQRVPAILSFVQAADRGSFVAAARALGISAAAVGKNVASLELALGVRLFNRTTRSLHLTEEGAVFLARARPAIDALDAAVDAVAEQRREAAGRVRISCGNTFGRVFLLPLLPGLLARHPGLLPEIDFDDRRVDLIAEGYDLGLRGGLLQDSALVSRHVARIQTVLAASPAYLAQAGIPHSLADLTQHRLIAVRFLGGTWSPWTFTAPEGGVHEYLPETASLVLSSPEAAVDAARMGMGIAQLGLHHAWEALQQGELKLVLFALHHPGYREIALQYPHRALLAPRVRVTVDYLVQALAQHPALRVGHAELAACQAQ
jgi:DNA-binding transcriptional LysR family regulator